MYGCKCTNSLLPKNNSILKCNCNLCTCKDKVFDTSLHMTNHYRRINSAKCVVNTSAPRCYNYRQKYSSDKGSTTRLSTPSVLSNYGRVPSRTNSNCEVRRKVHNRLQTDFQPAGRSSSVPPRPVTKRNPNISLQRKPISQYFKAPSKKVKIPMKTHDDKTSDSPKHTLVQQTVSEPPDGSDNDEYIGEQSLSSKRPIPTPRTMSQLYVPLVTSLPDYEYLQFSLRITEDIIRNDLYNHREMRRVFNSHIEANRDRLSMAKMLQTIDNLCKELSISKNVSRHIVNHDKYSKPSGSCTRNTQRNSQKSSELNQSSKQIIIEKIVSGQYEITDEEIKDFNENDLQQVITGIMSDDHVVECVNYDEPSEIIDIPQASFRASNSEIINQENSKKDLVQQQASSTTTIQEISSGNAEEEKILSFIPEESLSSNVLNENNSDTLLDDTGNCHPISESQLLKQGTGSHELKGTNKLNEIVSMEENVCERIEVQELIGTNITCSGSATTDAGEHKLLKNRSHSILVEAEAALKHVLANLPSWNSAPSSYLCTQDTKDSTTIVTTTPVKSVSNISAEKCEGMPSDDKIKCSSLSVCTNQQSLEIEKDIVLDPFQYKNDPSVITQNLSNVNPTEEKSNISGTNSIPNEQSNVSLNQESSSTGTVILNSPTPVSLNRQTSLNIEHTKQQTDVSINTEHSVADSCTQYDLVNMENSLKLGTDKCTQTSFHTEESQYLNTAATDNSSSNSSTDRVPVICTQSDSTVQYRCPQTNSESMNEGIVENDKDDVRTAENQQITRQETNHDHCLDNDIRIVNSNPEPSSDFVATIKQMLLENVTALSEIMDTPKRNDLKSRSHNSQTVNVDYNKYENHDRDKYRMTDRNEHSEIFLRSVLPVTSNHDVDVMKNSSHLSIPGGISRNSDTIIILAKENAHSISEGEISVSTGTNTDIPKDKARKDASNMKNYLVKNYHCGCEVLQRLQKYEHHQRTVSQSANNQPISNISLCDYELKNNYVLHCHLLANAGTQTSGTSLDENTRCVRHGSRMNVSNEILLSDGELRSTSTQSDYESRTSDDQW